MDIGIGIKVDPSDSASKADSVTTALHKTEDQGIAAGKAMLGLAGSFKALANAMQQQQAALERTGQAHRYLTSTSAGAAAGFGKMAEAMQREKAILEQIHGPARRYAEDLQVLDSLLARNVINTQQYADQVRRLNREIDGTPKPANSNVPVSSGPSTLSTLRGGAAALGLTMSAGALAGMADDYTNIQNRLRQMAPDQARANELFDKLHGIANRTRSELGATVDAFSGMTRATRALGLSQDETLRVTETLNKLVTISGKSATESAAGLMQFSQALSSGRLQGDELRSVFENMPTLVDALMKSLGKTQAQLREMGSAGQITSAVMVKALQDAAAGVDASMGKSIPTLSQSWTVFKNDMMAGVGAMNQSIGVTETLGKGLMALSSAVQLVAAPFRLIGAALDAIPGPAASAAKSIAAVAAASMLLGGPAGAIVASVIALEKYTTTFDEVYTLTADYYLKLQALEEAQRKVEVSAGALNGAFAGTSEALKRALPDMIAMNLQLALGTQAADAFKKALEVQKTAAADPFAGLSPEVAGEAIDHLTKLTEGTKEWFRAETDAERGARALVEARQNEVTVAKAQLAQLELAKGQVVDYAGKKQKLLDIINGVTSSTKKATGAYWEQVAALRAADAAAQGFLMRQRDLDRSVTGGTMQTSRIDLSHAQMPFAAGIGDGSTGRATNDEVAAMWGMDVNATLDASNEMRKQMDDTAQSAIDAAQRTREAWAQGLGSIAGSFLDAALAGKQSFADMASDMARQIAMLILKMAALKAISGGGSGAVAGQFLTGLLGGANGFSYVANSNARQLPGFATGGSFTVAGAGGTDSKVAAFRVTPGESVHVRTPQQTMAEAAYVRELRMAAVAGAGQQAPQITVIPPPQDPQEVTVAMGGNEGEKVHARWERKYKRRRLGA